MYSVKVKVVMFNIWILVTLVFDYGHSCCLDLEIISKLLTWNICTCIEYIHTFKCAKLALLMYRHWYFYFTYFGTFTLLTLLLLLVFWRNINHLPSSLFFYNFDSIRPSFYILWPWRKFKNHEPLLAWCSSSRSITLCNIVQCTNHSCLSQRIGILVDDEQLVTEFSYLPLYIVM